MKHFVMMPQNEIVISLDQLVKAKHFGIVWLIKCLLSIVWFTF